MHSPNIYKQEESTSPLRICVQALDSLVLHILIYHMNRPVALSLFMFCSIKSVILDDTGKPENNNNPSI